MRSMVVAVMLLAACGRLDFDPIGAVAADAPTCRGLDASWTPEWSSLILYQPFDGAGAIANDEAVPATVGMTGLAGNANGTGMTYVPGKVAQAIEFDGVDDYVADTASNIDTTAGDAVSVAFWMKWNGVLYAGNSGEWTKIVLFKVPEYALTFVSNGGNPAMGYNTGNGDLWGLGTGGLANTWVHVVAVFVNAPSNQSLIYVDGQAQPLVQEMGTATASSVSANLLVAALPAYPSYFAGDLDELAIWNTALTPGEVQTLYGAQQACP